jgi:(p)ppGpp synthase/HD superfamily hydrolase
MTELERKAKHLAMLAHTGQQRKYTGEPYIIHPIAVRDKLVEYGVTCTLTLSAALLHDVVEDTTITIQRLIDEVGLDVAELVYWLTDEDLGKENNRRTRKQMAMWRLSRAPEKAIQIKLADLIDNAKDVCLNDLQFAKIYLQEKRSLVNLWEATRLNQYKSDVTIRLHQEAVKTLNKC